MTLLTQCLERLRALVFRSRVERELDEEVAFHLEMETQKQLQSGLEPAAARREARLRFGGVERHKEAVRDARGVRPLEDMVQDLRYGLRGLVRSKGFTGAAVLTLAVGVGASTALFTAVNSLLLRPLPVEDPDRLVEIAAVTQFESGSFSHGQLEALRERSRSLEDLAAHSASRVAFGDDAYAEEVLGHFVTGTYFGVLGLSPTLGRLLGAEDDRPGDPTAGAVLSHWVWQERFGADSTVVGRTVRLNGHPVLVLGVAPRRFTGISLTSRPAFWAPLALQEQVVPGARPYSPLSFSLAALGRLHPGGTAERAEAELTRLAAQVREAAPGPVELEGARVRRASRIPQRHEGALLRFITLLSVATALVLLIAGANVASMLLARGLGRRRELAVRRALGADRRRLVRQLLTESGLLFLLGGGAGVLLSLWLTRLLLAFRWPTSVTLDVTPDARVLALALGGSITIGLAFTLLPAIRAARPSLVPDLRDGAHGSGRGGARLRAGLVVAQITMSILLLVGAGLFLRALHRALTIDPGFDPDGVVVASIDLHRHGYEEPQGREFLTRLVERARRVPGVESATLSISVPLGPGSEMLRLAPASAAEDEAVFVRANVVADDYFRTMRIPLVRGRGFAAGVSSEGPAVAVVNQSMAEAFWPDEEAIGKRFRQTLSAFQMMSGRSNVEAVEFEVVGVVPDGKYRSLREAAEPHVFVPFSQNYRSRMLLSLRLAPGAENAIGEVRREAQGLDASLPVLAAVPLTHLIADEFLPQRVGAILTTLFGLIGLLLAAIGLYGVMAYLVGQRAREIGIRVALGARAPDVLRLVLAHGFALCAAGVGLGLLAALVGTRFISSLLFGIAPTDPGVFVGTGVLLSGIGLLASWIPARRALRLDPVRALREE